jgi:hypothetical protein
VEVIGALRHLNLISALQPTPLLRKDLPTQARFRNVDADRIRLVLTHQVIGLEATLPKAEAGADSEEEKCPRKTPHLHQFLSFPSSE